MPRMVDADELIDSRGVAGILGLAQHQSVSVYRRRYSTFPPPVVDMGGGRCLLWNRSDIVNWAATRGETGIPAP
jgi:predicted DNA-binding transcriptional regulator AlpA